MKKTLLVLALIGANLNIAQNVNIPDANFKAYLVNNSSINTNQDSEIQVTEANSYTGGINCPNSNISDLTGIEAFTALNSLYCQNNQLTNIDLSQNVVLISLDCRNNQIVNLNVSQLTVLENLSCGSNQIASLDVSLNTELRYLGCDNNQLANLNITQNIYLNGLECSNNLLTSLDVTQNNFLQHIYCQQNQLTSLDVSNNTILNSLFCRYNQLTSLDVSQNTQLTVIQCTGNQLTVLDVAENINLNTLMCTSNQLTSLDVSQNDALIELWCHNNQLTNLNIANGSNSNIGYFDASGNPNLTCIQIDNGFTPPSSGWYKDATASYSNNCALSTNDFELSKQVVIYPNPVNDVLTIQNQDAISIKNYSVLDINGRVLVSQSKAIENNQINLSGLTSGVYILQLETDKGLVTKKIIKE